MVSVVPSVLLSRQVVLIVSLIFNVVDNLQA